MIIVQTAVCIYIYTHMHTYLPTYLYTLCVCMCVCSFVFTCVSVYVYMRVCMYVCMYVCMRIHVHVYIYIYVVPTRRYNNNSNKTKKGFVTKHIGEQTNKMQHDGGSLILLSQAPNHKENCPKECAAIQIGMMTLRAFFTHVHQTRIVFESLVGLRLRGWGGVSGPLRIFCESQTKPVRWM